MKEGGFEDGISLHSVLVFLENGNWSFCFEYVFEVPLCVL